MAFALSCWRRAGSLGGDLASAQEEIIGGGDFIQDYGGKQEIIDDVETSWERLIRAEIGVWGNPLCLSGISVWSCSKGVVMKKQICAWRCMLRKTIPGLRRKGHGNHHSDQPRLKGAFHDMLLWWRRVERRSLSNGTAGWGYYLQFSAGIQTARSILLSSS